VSTKATAYDKFGNTVPNKGIKINYCDENLFDVDENNFESAFETVQEEPGADAANIKRA